MITKENSIAILKAAFYGLDTATKLWKHSKGGSNKILSQAMSSLYKQPIGCIRMEWKVLRFFNNLKNTKTVINVLKASNIPFKYVITLGQITGMLYLLSVQSSLLGKSKYFEIDESLALMCYSVAALAYYIETIILQTRNYLRGKITKSSLLLTILKETLDNLGVLGYLGVVRRNWGFDLANCTGSFLAAILSLFLSRGMN